MFSSRTAMVSTSKSGLPPLPGAGASSCICRRGHLVASGRRPGARRGGTRVACACTAPPRSWDERRPALEGNNLPVSEKLRPDKERENRSDVLIECRDVHKSFGEKQILRGVSFKIRHGEAIGIIGPSGTGKSTILKVMAGLLAPDKGEVLICGKRRHGLVGDEEIPGVRIGLV